MGAGGEQGAGPRSFGAGPGCVAPAVMGRGQAQQRLDYAPASAVTRARSACTRRSRLAILPRHCSLRTTAMSTRHPEILWAQRSDKVYLTVELPDAKNAQVQLEPDGRFTFTATSKDAKYETELQLFGAVKVEASKINEGRRHTFCIIEKEEAGWWERLLKKEGKAPPFVKADWNHWIDEDEEDEAVKKEDFNMSRVMNDYPDLEHTPDSDDDEEDDAPDVSNAEV